MKVVGLLRAKNEAERLPELLEQMRVFCSKILLLDDNSEDGTVEVAKEYGVEVQYNTGATTAHEGRDRQRLHRWAEKYNPDWIYAPDCDEIMEEDGPGRVGAIVRAAEMVGIEAYQFPFLTLWGDRRHYRVDGIYRDQTAIRLFKYFPHYLPVSWEVHSAAACPELIARGNFCRGDIRLYHLGYMTPEQRLAKFQYYSQTFPVGSLGWKRGSGGRGDYTHILGREAEIRDL